MSAVNFDPVLYSGVMPVVKLPSGVYATCERISPGTSENENAYLEFFDEDSLEILITLTDWEYDDSIGYWTRQQTIR